MVFGGGGGGGSGGGGGVWRRQIIGERLLQWLNAFFSNFCVNYISYL